MRAVNQFCCAQLTIRINGVSDPVDVDVHHFVLILDILLVAFPDKMQKILSCIRHWKEAKKAKKARRKEQDKKRTEKGKGPAAAPHPHPHL